jgi:hypothetical protein
MGPVQIDARPVARFPPRLVQNVPGVLRAPGLYPFVHAATLLPAGRQFARQAAASTMFGPARLSQHTAQGGSRMNPDAMGGKRLERNTEKYLHDQVVNRVHKTYKQADDTDHRLDGRLGRNAPHSSTLVHCNTLHSQDSRQKELWMTTG